MKKGIAIVFLGTSLFCSCNGQSNLAEKASGKDSVFHINLEECIKASNMLKISDIASDVSYMELKMPQGKPLGTVLRIEVTDDYIFVMSMGSLYQFDHSGSFIRPIGRRGRGPGEYSAVLDINLNVAKRKILIPSVTKTLIYSFDGIFMDTTINPIRREAGGIMEDGDELYVGYERYGYTKFNLIALNSKSDTLFRIPNFGNYDTKGFTFWTTYTFRSPFYQYQGGIYYKGFEDNDTVWKVSRTGYRTHAILNMGKFKRPEPKSLNDENKKGDDGLKSKGDYYRINRMFEDSHYIYLSCLPYFNSALKSPLLVYDKQKRQGFRVKDSHGDDGITDDLNGGAPLLPQLITENYVVSVMDAVTFLEQNENRTGLSDKLKRFIATLNENSNPVVVLGKRKNS